MGRKSKLTPAIQAKIVQMVQTGLHGERAAVACGVSAGTYYNWINRGKSAKSGVYFDFFEAIKIAEATAEALLLGRIQVQARAGTWTAAAWIMERRWRERWGRHIKLEVDLTQLSDEQLERIASGESIHSVVADTSKG